MSGRKRERDDWDRGDEPDQAERRSRMGARINFPLDRDRQHLATGDRDEVSEGKKDKTAIAKGCVRIARYAAFSRPSAEAHRVFARASSCAAAGRAHEIVGASATVARRFGAADVSFCAVTDSEATAGPSHEPENARTWESAL